MMTTTDTQLTRLALTEIKPGINPRTEFDQLKLEELAQSLKDDGGAVQPIVVYQDDDGLYGLIAGERRWRASQLAGLSSVEAIVRPKPASHNARKAALKENMQREDLTPLEIARAVKDMLDEVNVVGLPIYSRTQLANELGKDVAFISRCLSLLSCSDRLQRLVHQGKAPMDIAAMIGSLPVDMHEMAENDIVLRPKPMTVVEAREHIAETYRRDLRKAQFKLDDATLVPGKPACHGCEFWGGKRDDVKGRFKDSVCLNPACYEMKQTAFVKLATAAADDGHGVPMLGEDMRAKIFSFDGVTLKGDCGYVAADEMPAKILLIDPKAEVGTWGEVLKDSDIAVQKILDGQGRVRTLYDARLAVQAATAPGSAVRTIFRNGNAVKSTTVATKADDHAAEKDKARATGVISSGIHWIAKIRDAVDAASIQREIARLIFERLTETADREWMSKVMGVKDPMDYERGISCMDYSELLGLSLVARTLRLQGPLGINGIASELAKMIGYDPKKEARDIEALVAAAVKVEPVANEPVKSSDKQRGGKREKNGEAEKKALEAYLETGSIAKAAEACGLDVESVKNWHKRRKWKALRETHLAK